MEHFEIYDVTNAIVTKDKAVTALFDGRYSSLMVIQPEQTAKGELRLKVFEPDGMEKHYWLNKFGLIPDAELNEMVSKLQPGDDRKKVYELLDKEQEVPRRKLEAYNQSLKGEVDELERKLATIRSEVKEMILERTLKENSEKGKKDESVE